MSQFNLLNILTKLVQFFLKLFVPEKIEPIQRVSTQQEAVEVLNRGAKYAVVAEYFSKSDNPNKKLIKVLVFSQTYDKFGIKTEYHEYNEGDVDYWAVTHMRSLFVRLIEEEN